jgi:hypothetical protein
VDKDDGLMVIDALLPWMRWLLAFHIMSVMAWMAGLFYLPRLFVYHCQVVPGTAESERFKADGASPAAGYYYPGHAVELPVLADFWC